MFETENISPQSHRRMGFLWLPQVPLKAGQGEDALSSSYRQALRAIKPCFASDGWLAWPLGL
ncbi:MAG: hypothetical protein AB1585_18280 [Thermodesulfobacteriota bacterium]